MNAPSSGIEPRQPHARTKVELLYRDLLHDSAQLLTRMEQLTSRQQQIEASLQSVPAEIRRAGLDAAAHAGDHAARTVLEADRSIGRSTADLRIAARVVTDGMPAVIWRTGLLCAVSAFLGAGVGAALMVALMTR